MQSSRRQSQVGLSRLLLEQLEQRYLLRADLLTVERFEAFTALEPDSPEEVSAPMAAARGELFEFSSKPGSNFTIYLDFDGHVTEGTSWNFSYGVETIEHPPYDTDGRPDVITSTEMDNMMEAWRRTAEDFAPFDVNVTTVEPRLDALIRADAMDDAWGVRVVMTSDTFADCGCGGHAFIGSFNDDVDTPALVYNSSRSALGETIAHEVGHTIFLSHDGLSYTTYYSGHGVGATGWGAVMGAPFNQNTTQWDQGEYFDANNGTSSANYGNGADDLDVITTLNGFGYRADDHGDELSSATELFVSPAPAPEMFLAGYGIIERNTDVDFFEFETGAGQIDLDVVPIVERPNVDLWAGIYDEAGSLIVESNRFDDHTAGFAALTLAEGRYFLKVDGIGSHGVYNPTTDRVEDPTGTLPWQMDPPVGYSDYGSLGQYSVTGTVQLPPTPNQLAVTVNEPQFVEGNAGTTQVSFRVSRAGDLTQPAETSYRVISAGPTFVGETTPYSVDAEDFVGGTLPMGTVSFDVNEAIQTLVLEIEGDTDFEPDETLTVELYDETDPLYLIRSTASVTILADETQFAMDETAGFQIESDPFSDSGIALRWRQVDFSGEGFDEWGLDNVSFSTAPFADDMDPTADYDLWGQISGAEVNNAFGGAGNSLFFTGGSSRMAISPLLAATPGDTIEFDLIMGNNSNGGDNVESGEDIVLEYSTNNGASWTELTRYVSGSINSWTTLSVPMPSEIVEQAVDSYEFSVMRRGDVTEMASIDWVVVPLTSEPTVDADDFLDQVLPAGTIDFTAGSDVGTARLTIRPDLDLEPTERFLIQLSNPSGDFGSIDPGFSSSLQIIADDESQVAVKGDTLLRWSQNEHSYYTYDQWALDNVITSNGPVDDFDPDIDLSQWSGRSNGEVNQTFGGGDNSLFFSGSGPRHIVSNPLSPVAGDAVEFDLILGNGSNGGDNVESGEGIVLEYSVDNLTSWQALEYYDSASGMFDGWSTLTFVLPEGALADVTDQVETNAGDLAFRFGVVRSGNLDKFVALDWTVAGVGANPADANDFADGVLPAGTVTFKPSQTQAAAEFFVAGDDLLESDETFEFRISASSGGPFAANTIAGTIFNDDSNGLLGDFDGDGDLDCDDVSRLIVEINGGNLNALYDVTGDGQVNGDDLSRWVIDLFGTRFGDGNLDRVIDEADFALWFDNRFSADRGWCGGDFNGNGYSDGYDFLIWNNNRDFDPSNDVGTATRKAAVRINGRPEGPTTLGPTTQRVDEERIQLAGGAESNTTVQFYSEASGRWLIAEVAIVELDAQTALVDMQLASASFAWHNAVLPADVNHDGRVSPLDALLVIGELNQARSSSDRTGLLDQVSGARNFYDVNSDGYVSPLDAVMVLNELSQQRTAMTAEPLDDNDGRLDDDDRMREVVERLFATVFDWA